MHKLFNYINTVKHIRTRFRRITTEELANDIEVQHKYMYFQCRNNLASQQPKTKLLTISFSSQTDKPRELIVTPKRVISFKGIIPIKIKHLRQACPYNGCLISS